MEYERVSHHPKQHTRAETDGGDFEMDKTETSYAPAYAPLPNPPQNLGRKETKPVFALPDLLSLLLCFIAWSVGMAAVTNNDLAWRLGYTNQLVVVGFILSVMYYCFKWIVPTLLLLCEARWGRSTLQNFDAIVTDSSLASHVDWWWRVTLWLVLALQLGLSASYKVTGIASASVQLKQDSDIWTAEWGLNPPPGLLPLGGNAGLLLMTNVTAPFLQLSSNLSANTDQEWNDVNNDLPLPPYPHAVGFNIVLLDPNTTALLDTPRPDWITSVQGKIGYDDAVVIEADVLGTVSQYDPSASAHPDSYDPWWRFSPFSSGSSNITVQALIWFYSAAPQGYDPSRSAPCFISLHSNDTTPSVNASLYNTFRRQCHGRWRITQRNMHLEAGSCDIGYEPAGTEGTVSKPNDPPVSQTSNTFPAASAQNLPTPTPNAPPPNSTLLTSRSQLIFTNNTSLDLQSNYVPLLKELLTPFFTKPGSRWKQPSMVTTVAAMYWSRVTAAQGPSSPHRWAAQGFDSFSIINFQNPEQSVQFPNTTTRYFSTPTALLWERPAMRKTAPLYVVLGVLPVLCIAAVIAIAVLHHVPLGKGFGMVAILAGIERETLGLLRGAAFSGELTDKVYVRVRVEDAPVNEIGHAEDATMRYRLNAHGGEKLGRHDRVRRRTVLA